MKIHSVICCTVLDIFLQICSLKLDVLKNIVLLIETSMFLVHLLIMSQVLMAASICVDAVHGHSHDLAYRRALKASVSGLLCEIGFASAENDTLETLTEMLQSGK
jgi:Bromodomain associated